MTGFICFWHVLDPHCSDVRVSRSTGNWSFALQRSPRTAISVGWGLAIVGSTLFSWADWTTTPNFSSVYLNVAWGSLGSPYPMSARDSSITAWLDHWPQVLNSNRPIGAPFNGLGIELWYWHGLMSPGLNYDIGVLPANGLGIELWYGSPIC